MAATSFAACLYVDLRGRRDESLISNSRMKVKSGDVGMCRPESPLQLFDDVLLYGSVRQVIADFLKDGAVLVIEPYPLPPAGGRG